jgi:hypothetical protein
MTPPPTTTNSSGTLSNANAPVELTITFSSYGIPGKEVGSEPVAIIVFFAFI